MPNENVAIGGLMPVLAEDAHIIRANRDFEDYLNMKPKPVYNALHLAEAIAYAREIFGWKKQLQGVGSVAILGEGADCDVIIKTNSLPKDEKLLIEKHGFVKCGGEYDINPDDWTALRKGGVNFILIHKAKHYNSFVSAVEFCSSLHKRGCKMDSKEIRKFIHEYFRANL